MYTIVVSYTTGDSFGSYQYEEDIGLVWGDKELARECLNAIKEHYNIYKELDEGIKDDKEILETAQEHSWYQQVNEWGDEVKDKYSFMSGGCRAKLDDGSFRTVPTSMWCGYFESLQGARISILKGDIDWFEI